MLYTSYCSIPVKEWAYGLESTDLVRDSAVGMRVIYQCTLRDVNGEPYVTYMEQHHKLT